MTVTAASEPLVTFPGTQTALSVEISFDTF